LYFIHARYGWFKSQKEDIRSKVIADNLTDANTALSNLNTSFSGSLPGNPEDTASQKEIDHAQLHINSAIAEATGESKTNQKDRVIRSIDGLDI